MSGKPDDWFWRSWRYFFTGIGNRFLTGCLSKRNAVVIECVLEI
jgi:hypothetical protein